MQLRGQHAERIEQRLAARDHDGLRRTGRGPRNDGCHLDRRIEARIPRILGVAPAAPHVAAAQADEVGRLARMVPLALDGIEILDQRKQPPAVEQLHDVVRHLAHHSVTT